MKPLKAVTGARQIATGAIVLAVIAAGCGSRLSHQQLLADARRGAPQSQLGSESNPGGFDGADTTTPAYASSGASTGAGTAGASPGQSSSTSAQGSTSAGIGGGAAGPTQGGCPKALSPVVIGSVGEQSGIVGSVSGLGIVGVQTWLASVNAAGGLNCHPVKYIVEDDGGDPSRNQSEVQQLVEANHVKAFVYMDAPIAGQASVNYLTQKQIPVIGSETGSGWFLQSPMYFPQASSGVAMLNAIFAGAASAARIVGSNKFGALSCVEISLCSQFHDIAPAQSARFGLDLVYNVSVSLVQPDYTAQCQGAQSAGAKILLAGVDPNSVDRLARSCATINYHPTYLIPSVVVRPQLTADPNLEGAVGVVTTIPFMVTATPAVAAYQTALRRYAPGQEPDADTMLGWAAAQLFGVAAQDLSEPPTSQSILDGLWAIKNNDLRGLTEPLTFTKGQNAPATLCFWIVQIKNHQYVPGNGGQRTCE